jgi:pimeloyl-ACP methyl ester carboxylesterase
LVINHGWPGSVLEQVKLIEPLTNPVAHGGKAEEAFDVVIPSMPGYGFSGKPNSTGWDPARIANAWLELMKRLGYTRFVAQGGDWGAIITDVMAGGRDAPMPSEPAPPELIGIHSNMPGAVPPEIDKAIQAGEPPPSTLTDEERHAWDQLAFFYSNLGYGQIMGNRPQTLYGLTDSPVGLASFMLDHDARSYDLIARAFGGEKEGLSRDDVLDNISLFWLTNTGVSAARLYWENKFSYFSAKNVSVPAAVSAFPDELYQTPRSWAEQAYPNLMYYNDLDRGGHFAAWEQPELFASEVRAGFRPLRA